MEDGQYLASDRGTPKGRLISPVLANVYLHYVEQALSTQAPTHKGHMAMAIEDGMKSRMRENLRVSGIPSHCKQTQ